MDQVLFKSQLNTVSSFNQKLCTVAHQPLYYTVISMNCYPIKPYAAHGGRGEVIYLYGISQTAANMLGFFTVAQPCLEEKGPKIQLSSQFTFSFLNLILTAPL